MENVRGAPIPSVPGYTVVHRLLHDGAVGGATQRVRRFSFGSSDGRWLDVETLALFPQDLEPAALASGSGNPVPVPVRIGGSGKVKRSSARNLGYKTTGNLRRMCENQGLPADFMDGTPFTVAGKCKAVGNGVPLPMGRAVARAVVAAMKSP